MKCPHCHVAAESGQDFCRDCGFSAATLRAYLGDQWVRLERITDAVHCLRLEDVRRCEIAMDDFERCLPQAFFALYIGVLPTGLNVSELGFWLLNQGAFNTHQMMKRNDFGSVLVIDPVSKTMGLTLGYAIEECLPAAKVTALLSAAGAHLSRQSFATAVLEMIEDIAKSLRKLAKASVWHPEKSVGGGIHVQPLRSGHRHVAQTQTGGLAIK